LVVYFFAVLRFLGDPLKTLYTQKIMIYAFAGLGLIVVQAVVLEAVTGYLIRLLRLDRFE
jgi:hypothetical protein